MCAEHLPDQILNSCRLWKFITLNISRKSNITDKRLSKDSKFLWELL